MITPLLEKLILSGNAKFMTQNIGGGGAGTIPCPDSQTIVVTSFIWNPFNDFNTNDPLRADLRTLHTLRLRADGKEVAFNLRDTFITQGVAPDLYRMFNSPQQYNCFFVAKSDIQTGITVFEGNDTWIVDFSTIPASANEPDNNGYGFSPVLRSVQTVNRNIDILGFERDPAVIVPGGLKANQFLDGYGLVNRLINPTADPQQRNTAYPAVTFNYVLINKMPTFNLD